MLVCLLTALPALGHEFWIEPQEYQVETGAEIVANLRNGQNFAGIDLAYFERRTVRFDLVQDGATTPVEARMGDVPALRTRATAEGLMVIVHQTAPATLTYKEWEKFAKFAAHKDFPDIRARHAARGLPETGFTESYSRFAKALVAVGDGQGSDIRTGMETEFVVLTNPYTAEPGTPIEVLVLYAEAPRTNAQVEIFDRSPDGTVTVTTTRTNAEGVASVPVIPGHDYLLDAVVLRPAPKGGEAVWETLWASTSFSVPAR